MTQSPSEKVTVIRPPGEKSFIYQVIRYTPNLVRDEWANIGILIFDDMTGHGRLRMIEGEEEYRRVRRLHPQADELVLRNLRGLVEDLFQLGGFRGNPAPVVDPGQEIEWKRLFEKWNNSLSNLVQFGPKQGLLAHDLEVELERLYTDKVAVQYAPGRIGLPGSRARVRSYCSQVFHQARLWERIEKSVPAERWTLPGDPMRIDYSYRRNGTRGFVHTLSVTRAPGDFKQLAYTVEHIQKREKLKTEFAAVTDVPLERGNKRDDFIAAALREVGIEPVAMEGFAVWVAKLKPLLL
jgi:hypothetical protein